MSGPSVATAQFPDEQSADGAFVRQQDAFRDWVSADGSTAFPAAAGRYHLYVSLACPWAHRTVIVRKLRGLETAVGMTVVDPVRDERGWAFRDGAGFSKDPLNGFRYLREAYVAREPAYRGRVTVPVLWDTQTKASSAIPTTTSCACSSKVSMLKQASRSTYIRLPCGPTSTR